MMFSPGGQPVLWLHDVVARGGGKGGGGSVPAAPDPVATAQAQSAANADTARVQATLNRVNQYTPQGSITWSQRGPDLWDATTTLSPEQQNLYNLSTQGQQIYGQTALNQLNAAADTLSKPMTGSPYADFSNRAATYGMTYLDKVGNPQNPDFVDPASGLRTSSLGAAKGTLAQANLMAGQPINTNYNAIRQQAIDAANSRLDPQFKRDEEAMRSRLLAQGITPGSAAWNDEYSTFNQGRNDARMQTLLNAENLAGQSIAQTGQLRGIPLNELNTVNAMAGNSANVAGTGQQQAMADYMMPYQRAAAVNNIAAGVGNLSNQGLQQQMMLRTQPLNETNSLLTGQMIQTPGAMQVPQVNVAPTDVIGATMGSYNGQLQAYNARQQAQAANMGGLYGLGGSALMGAGMLFSDERLKTDIRRVGETDAGVPLYQYRYKGSTEPHIGVLAQELKKTQPGAVAKVGPFLAVDYDRVR